MSSRYSFSKRTNLGRVVGPSKASYKIYRAVESGAISSTLKTLEEGERLDQLAGVIYGNSTLWWIIAAASGIGWGLQAPPGTILYIPLNLADISRIVG